MSNPNAPRLGEPTTPDLPPALKQELQALYQPATPLPAATDDEILRLARRQMVRQRANRAGWLYGGAAAAAVVLLMVGYQLSHPAKEPGGASPAAAARKSVGDIREAFQLARQLQAGRRPDLTWDANGDGKVDQTDVTVLAEEAVRLERGTL